MSLTIPAARIVEESDSPLLKAPESWQRKRLGDVATILNGFAFKSRQFVVDGGTPLIRIRDIKNATTVVGYAGDYDARYIVHGGELLIGMDGDFNCARWAGPNALLNQRVCKVTPDANELDLDYLTTVLPGYLRAIHDATSSTTVTHLSSRDVADIPLPLPPVEVQRALVDLTGNVANYSESAGQHLTAARRAIARFRQAVLAAACSGRLTEDWRERDVDHSPPKGVEHSPVETTEPISAWKAGFLEPADFPETWQLVSLDGITTKITSGSRDWSKYYGSGEGTFIMAQNVRPGKLDWTYRQAVNPPIGDRSRERSQVQKGDLLVTIVGANTGDVGPVVDDRPHHYVCQSVALIRPTLRDVSPFLNLWFNSAEHGQRYFQECIYGAGRPHLSFDQLRIAPVALPSLEEQWEILHRTESLMAAGDQVRARINVATNRVEQTSQAVLGKAFSGAGGS